MPVSIPPLVTEPFAKNAASTAITLPIPLGSQIGLSPGAASFEDGFPPVTMQPIVAGGVPPFGQDMNGILFMLSSHTAFAQGGQWYEFDPTVAAAIGGYALGTYLAMADGSGFWLSIATGNSANPDTGGSGWVALYSYGEAVIPVTVGTLALTPDQFKKRVLVVTGALAGNVQLVFPNTQQEWLIVNNTSGAFSVNVTCSGSASQVLIAAGGPNQPTGIWSDGVNLYVKFQPATAQASSQDAIGLTLAQRTNAGYLLATYFNQNSGIEDGGIGAVFYQNPQADGYLRKSSVGNFIAQLGLATTGWVNQSIANMSAWLQSVLAPKNSPALTGVPSAPTAPPGTNSTQIATCAFVRASVPIIKCGTFACASGQPGTYVPLGFNTLIGLVVCGGPNQSQFQTVCILSKSAAGFSASSAANNYVCSYIAVGS